MKHIEYIDKLTLHRNLEDEELLYLISAEYEMNYLIENANKVRRQIYGDEIYVRGLIEFTNYCKNGCYYCGLNNSNARIDRYRLSADEIIRCCDKGYALGIRTFVLQGGEDPFYTDDILVELVSGIKTRFDDCAVTLSIGERSKESYARLYEAGADRYLLRHETSCEDHYSKLHPGNMKLSNRIRCLYDLKELGYQVGSGFMVGSPYQEDSMLVGDLRLLQKIDPDMIGIGPFISHEQTIYSNSTNGDVDKTIKLVAILRLMFPHALIPATTALATISEDARWRALGAGANVLMPNLSPTSMREKYNIYDNKASFGLESALEIDKLRTEVSRMGYEIVVSRGDVRRN